jgi:ubiquinone/menaquinone biosynthesis C-methylase UbiE
MFAKFLARQLGRPSGVWGLVLAPIWNKRNAALNDVAFQALALSPQDRVLEVGFGGGYLLGRMAQVVTAGFLAGADASPSMVAFCAARYRALVSAGILELQCAPAEALPYPAGHFGKACSVNSLFYWQNASQALAELWRVLAEGGLLVLCFTAKHCLEGREFSRHGVALYETEEVHRLVEAAGFGEIRLTPAADKHREFVCLTGRK